MTIKTYDAQEVQNTHGKQRCKKDGNEQQTDWTIANRFIDQEGVIVGEEDGGYWIQLKKDKDGDLSFFPDELVDVKVKVSN